MSDLTQSKQRGSSRSLGSILALSLFSLSLTALLVAGCLQVFFNVRIRNLALAGMQQIVAAEARRAVSSFVSEKIGELESAIWITSPHTLSRSAQRDLLASLLGRQPALRRLLLLDSRDRITALVSRRSSIAEERAESQRILEASSRLRLGTGFLSPVYIDEVSSEPLFIIALPLRDVFGASHGVLLAEMNLKFMWDLVESLEVGRTGYAYVVDREGSLIAFGDNFRVLTHENVKELAPVSAFIASTADGGGTLFRGYKGLKGGRVIGTYLPLGTPDWAVVVELPWAEAYGDTIREIALVAVLYLLMAGLVSAAGISVARRLAAPIERLMQTAELIASGERELQAEVEGPREIAALSRAFNSMTSQLRESLEELDRYFTTALDLLCIADTDGRFRRLNMEWEAALGYSIEELEGRSFLDFVHPEDKERTLAEVARLRGQEEVQNFVNRYRHKDGTYRWIEWRSFPHGKMIYAVARDITKRKQSEDEIRKLNESLEERVAERTAQLKEMNKELESFTYSIAHDLRAPLRAINGYTRIISDDYQGALDEEGKRILSVIHRETRRMDQLIENLLAFARIGRSALKHMPLDMGEIVCSVFETLLEPGARERIDLHIGELPAAIGDPTLLREVWMNLLSNAIKFTSKTERASIRIEGTMRGNECVYSVHDNGAGFDMRYAEKLFGVFQRLHTPHEFEGNGIGLAMVQRIVVMHGGRVWAEGQVGKGAVFSFSLPRVAPT